MKPVSSEIQIPVHYISVGILSRKRDFPYCDSFFEVSSETFNQRLAQASLGLAVSADRDSSLPIEKQNFGVSSFFKDAGFDREKYYLYDAVPQSSTCACAMACKNIDDFTLIAVTVCGNGYGAEWEGNLNVGEGDIHSGFLQAAKLVQQNIIQYIRHFRLNGKIKIWMAGYSRASAILNLAGRYAVENNICNELYAYLFATPSVTKDFKDVKGMFNIIGSADPFANVLPADWKMGRNGKTLCFGEPENEHLLEIIAWQLGCKCFRTNQYINDIFSRIISDFNVLFPTTEEYCRNMQDILISIHGRCNIFNIAKSIIRLNVRVKKFDEDRRIIYKKLKKFIFDELSLFRVHKKLWSEVGLWVPGERFDTNILREHSGDMYVIRIFSCSVQPCASF